jgi:Siphovirus Gp157
MRLFELAAQHRALLALEDSDELPAEVIRDTLEALEGDIEQKCIAVAKFILNLEAAAEAIEIAAQAMQSRSDRLQKRADNIRHYLLLQLQIMDRKKIDTAELIIARRNNPVAVVIGEGAEIPESFMVQQEPPPKRPDKKALKTALQAGTVIPGVFLESGERIQIDI